MFATLDRSVVVPVPALDKYAVDSKTVIAQLDNNESVLVVDVRAEDTFRSGHLFEASNDNYLDSSILEKRVNTIQNRLPDIVSSYKNNLGG